MDEQVQKTEILEKTVLTLDLSTTCTGYAVFRKDGTLIKYDRLKPITRGLTQYTPVQKKIVQMDSLIQQIRNVIAENHCELIIIEEITGSRSRLTQKTLDGFHWLVYNSLFPYLPNVRMYDVTGANGWRTHLKLKLTANDKLRNKESAKLNKKIAKGTRKIPKIGPKHLACRFVNAEFNTQFDVDKDSTDADVCDAIAMGVAFFRLQKKK